MTLWSGIAGAEGKGKVRWKSWMRERIRGTIEIIVEQELEEAVGAASSERVGEQRAGYRHGHRARTLTTSLGVHSHASQQPSPQASDA
jgi:transposase-like protein